MRRCSRSAAPHPLPQDEILARLLFGESVAQLTTLQIAGIGAAIVTLSGAGGGGGFNPLNTVQQALGLNRLVISSASSNPGTTGGAGSAAGQSSTGAVIEAGRYISNRVYVGARQSTTGTTQAQVQIDLTRNWKLQTTLSTGGGPVQGVVTPQNDPGSSVGMRYQFRILSRGLHARMVFAGGKRSAGILAWRRIAAVRGATALEVFLVHPGGPFWARRDAGAWSIPKGEYASDEPALAGRAARVLRGDRTECSGPVHRAHGHYVSPVASSSAPLPWRRPSLDPAKLRSNLFRLEWPPRSGLLQEFPEVDRAAWFALPEAHTRLLAGQRGLLQELAARLGAA